MRRIIEIARTGATSIVMYPGRSLATCVCVLVVLGPFLIGLGISRGIQAEAAISVDAGADLYVTGWQLGQRVPVSLELQSEILKIDGVTSVVPRIVGGIELGKNRERAVLVGMPASQFPAAMDCVEGRMPVPSNVHELVVGVDLARRLKLEVGSIVPPFYRNDRGERLSRVVGLFRSDASLWQSSLILTTLESAADIFEQTGLATDLLVNCRPGVVPFVRQNITLISPSQAGDGSSPRRLATISREDLQALLPTRLLHREGIFNLHFGLLFVAAILALHVTSGLGHSERRREVGILKAIGWQTDEILLRSLVEGLLLSIMCECLVIFLSVIWLYLFNGYWIASVFLAGAGTAPNFRVPFRLGLVPILVTSLISLTLCLTGSIYTSWRAAIVSPVEALK